MQTRPRLTTTGLLACLVIQPWSFGPAMAVSRDTTVVPVIDRPLARELRELVEQAWDRRPVIRAAVAAIASAELRVEGARLPINNPTLELDVEKADVETLTVGINQTLDWNDKRRSRIAIAEAERRVAEAELSALRQRVAVEVLSALARYRTARGLQVLALDRTRLMRRFAETVERRHRAGDMQALDAAMARLALSESVLQQAAIDGEVAESIAELRAVTGLDRDDWPDLPISLLPSIDDDSDDRSMVDRIPALIVTGRGREVTEARLDLAGREARPDPTLGLRAGRDGSSGLVGIGFEIPLFVRNDHRSAIGEARQAVVIARARYEETRRRARSRLEGSRGRFESVGRAWTHWDTSGRQAHVLQTRLLERLWQAGELTASDYLIQAKQGIDVQVAAHRLAGEVWQAAIDWLDASGGVSDWLGLVSQRTTNLGGNRP